MHTIASLLLGYIVGIVVNLLADYLPARRHYDIARRSPFTTVKPTPPRLLPRRPPAVDGERQGWYAPHAYSGLISALGRLAVFDPPRRWRRIAVEAGLAVGFAAITALHGVGTLAPNLGYLFFYAASLTLIAVIDLEHRMVMVEVIALVAGVALFEARFFPRHPLPTTLQAAWMALLIMGGLYALGISFGILVRLVTGKHVGRTILGLGDVEIAVMGGLILGWQALGPALLVMSLTGGVGALIFIGNRFRRKRGYRRFSTIAYGPYICIGIALALYLPTVAGELFRYAVGWG
jgi:prepilin signal peptidase PulO-like enzyme (type II secretory pathway)